MKKPGVYFNDKEKADLARLAEARRKARANKAQWAAEAESAAALARGAAAEEKAAQADNGRYEAMTNRMADIGRLLRHRYGGKWPRHAALAALPVITACMQARNRYARRLTTGVNRDADLGSELQAYFPTLDLPMIARAIRAAKRYDRTAASKALRVTLDEWRKLELTCLEPSDPAEAALSQRDMRARYNANRREKRRAEQHERAPQNQGERVSLRAIAAPLGLSASTVSRWHKKGELSARVASYAAKNATPNGYLEECKQAIELAHLFEKKCGATPLGMQSTEQPNATPDGKSYIKNNGSPRSVAISGDGADRPTGPGRALNPMANLPADVVAEVVTTVLKLAANYPPEVRDELIPQLTSVLLKERLERMATADTMHTLSLRERAAKLYSGPEQYGWWSLVFELIERFGDDAARQFLQAAGAAPDGMTDIGDAAVDHAVQMYGQGKPVDEIVRTITPRRRAWRGGGGWVIDGGKG